jgi:uncharacterized protein
MNTLQMVKSKRRDILRTAAEHGASNVRIFGSVATGKDDEASDIDFLVVLEPGRTLLDRAALLVDLEDLLGRKVDVATERTLKDRIKDRVLTQAIPV